MNKSRFVRQVLARVPEMASIDTFFYFAPFDHILGGFCCEMTPAGAYVWRFLYPLYDRFDTLTLLYSWRLSGEQGYIKFDKNSSEDKLAEDFVLRVTEHLGDSKKCLRVEQFCEIFDSRPALIKNPRAEMVFGYSKILLDEKAIALTHLKHALGGLKPPYRDDCQRVADLLELDLGRAQEAILGFESEMRARIALPVRER